MFNDEKLVEFFLLFFQFRAALMDTLATTLDIVSYFTENIVP